MPAELETARPGSSAGPDGSGSKPGTAPSLRSLQQQTKVMMEYLTGLLSSEDALAVKQQRLVLTRQATRAKIKSMVTHADTAMLELCLQAAKDAELPQEDVDRVIAAVASAQALREAVTSEVKADVAAAVRHWEELCKPNGPACGPLYEDARMLLRRLTKQELERGWRCSSPFSGTASTPAADAGADPGTATSSPRNEQSVRAAGEQAPRASSTGRALSPYKSWAELKHEQLMQQGAQTYEDWLAQKQEQDQQAQLQLRDKRLKERRQQLQKVTCSADMALTKLQQERQWPSRTLDAYPPGTFAVSPDRIRATKETYKRTFAGQLPASRSADLAVRGDASFSSRHEAVYAAQISSPADAEHAPETAAAPAED